MSTEVQERKDLSQIAPGDRVWVGHSNFPRARIQTVARLTPTLVILDGHYREGAKSEYNRYRRRPQTEWLWQVGGGSNYISEIATPEECAQWEAEQEADRLRREEQQRERELLRARRDELNALFGDNVSVGRADYESRADRPWDVCFALDEAGVRLLAKLVKSL